jgi:hypothetical protein
MSLGTSLSILPYWYYAVSFFPPARLSTKLSFPHRRSAGVNRLPASHQPSPNCLFHDKKAPGMVVMCQKAIFPADEKQFLVMTDTRSIVNFRRREALNTNGDLLWTPFFFDLPDSSFTTDRDAEESRACCSIDHERPGLPPSFRLRVIQQLLRPTFDIASVTKVGACDITYSITARLLKGEYEVARTSKKWLYTPTTIDPSPPLAVSDFPGEYQISAQNFAMDLLHLKRYGRLSVHIAELSALLIEQDKIHSAKTVSISPIFRLYPPSGLAGAKEPVLCECECTFFLEADSFFSPSCQGMILPRAHPLPPSLIFKGSSGQSQRCRFPLQSWHPTIGMFNRSQVLPVRTSNLV